MYHKILVPVDGSDPSNRGLLEAIKLAKSQDAQIKLLHVVDEHVLDTGYCIGTYVGDVSESFRVAGETILRNAVALVRQAGLEPETLAVESLGGDIAPMIIAQAMAWPAELIVMGTHGRRGLRRLAMGSDAEDVVRGTRIPVLLVHGEAASTSEATVKEPETEALTTAAHA